MHKCITPNTRRIINYIEEYVRTTPSPTPLIKVISEYYTKSEQLHPDSADETAESMAPTIAACVLDMEQRARREGTIWQIEICGTNEDHVRAHSFTYESMSPSEQRKRKARAHNSTIHTIVRNTTPQEFEILCSQVLGILGCDNPQITPLSGDGGIDFYGRLSLKGRLDEDYELGGIDQRISIWLVGQAKRYRSGNPVRPKEVRELIGSMELLRTKAAPQAWQDLNPSPFDPIIQLFFTTGDFSEGSRTLLRAAGIISMNGNQISTLLTDSFADEIYDLKQVTKTRFQDLLLANK